jgi:hypothetical protein
MAAAAHNAKAFAKARGNLPEASPEKFNRADTRRKARKRS